MTSIPAIAKFPAVQLTDNNLIDAISFIMEKNILVLHNEKTCRIFHAITFSQEPGKENLEDVRVIYLNTKAWPGLLEDGGWEYYIKINIKDVNELGVDSLLRKRLTSGEKIPNAEYIKLGAGCRPVDPFDTGFTVSSLSTTTP